MVWCCRPQLPLLLLLLLLGVLLGVAGGFQLRVPHAALQQSKDPRAPRRGHTSKPWPVSSTTTSTTSEEKQGDHHQVSPSSGARTNGLRHDEGRLEWAKQWYPVLVEKFTDAGRAQSVQLLGKDLVIWRSSDGTWATFDDRCPHRAVPLSEGRVEKDGSLSCAYHGWRFDSDGKCLKIPQSEKRGRDEAQAAACPKVYPTQVLQGIIWVWGENGPDAGLESALTSPPLIPALNDAEALEAGRVIACPYYLRELPYAWETFLENVVDPAHAVVSHHGIIGNRDMAAPMKIDFPTPSLSKDGFSFHCSSPFAGRESVGGGALQFCGPSLVILDTVLEDGSVLKLGLYGVPVRPGWCRVIFCQMFVASPDDKDAQEKKIIRTPGGVKPQHLPVWVHHIFGHRFLNQDMVFLHHQEKTLASGGYDSSNYGKAVYTPTAADKGVLAMRRWIAKYAPDGPTWSEGCDTAMPSRERNRDELFNIYEHHTKSCTSCLGALKRVNQLLLVAKASAAASSAWAVLRGTRAVGIASASSSASVLNLVTARAMLPGLAVMFASLGSIKVLGIIHKEFHTGHYHHQDNE